MGIVACYIEADVQLLDELKKKDESELFYIIEELQDEEDVDICDIDKMWDGLHYLLTGISATTPIDGNPLSEAIVGVSMFSDNADVDFVSYIYPDSLKLIAEKLNAVNMDDMRTNFSVNAFAQKGIYPDIWINEDEDTLFQELLSAFQELREYYNAIVKKSKGVIISIY